MDIEKAIEVQIDYMSRVISMADGLESKFGKWPHRLLLIDWVQTQSTVAPGQIVAHEEFVAKIEGSYQRAISLTSAEVEAETQALEDEAAQKRLEWLRSFDEHNEEIARLFEGEEPDASK